MAVIVLHRFSCIILTLLGSITQLVLTQRLHVVVPPSVGVSAESSHMNVTLSVIGGHREHHVTLTVTSRRSDGTEVVGQEKAVTILAGTIQPVLLSLPKSTVRNVCASGKDDSVTLVVSCETSTNQKESKELRVFLRSGYVLIQTDRPTYRRGETVMVRTMAVNGDFVLQGRAISLEIKDSVNTTILFEEIPGANATYETGLNLEGFQPTGDWYIRAIHDQQILATTRFYVVDREPILKPFEVELEVPNKIIVRETLNLEVHVAARESFGLPILGRVKMTVSLIKDGKRVYEEDGTDSVELDDGKATFDFDLTKLYHKVPFDFNDLIGSRLHVKVDIFDESGRHRQVADAGVVFSDGDYNVDFSLISLTRNPEVDVHPVELNVKHHDGTPASFTNVELMHDNGLIEEGHTNGDGYFYRELQSPTNMKVVIGNSGMKKTERTFNITKTNGPTIRISPFRAEKTVGDDIVFRIERPMIGRQWYYVVMARSKVLQSGSNTADMFHLHLDNTMIPSVTVTVWGNYNNVTVSHSATVTVVSACSEKFKMIVIDPNGNELKDGDWVEPGNDVTLKFTGDFQKVALKAVDSLTYTSYHDAMSKDLQIEDIIGSRYLIHDKVSILGHSDVDDSQVPRFERTRRSLDDCPWKFKQCRSEGWASRAMSSEQCSSHTKTVFSTKHGCKGTCVKAYYNSCMRKFRRTTRRLLEQPSGEMQDELEEKVAFIPEPDVTSFMEREDFRPSWLFEVKNVNKQDNQYQVAAHIPDSITKWYITAVGLSDSSPLCVARANITVKKSNFIKLHLPAIAKVGEVIEAKVIIYQLELATGSGVQNELSVDHPVGICHNWEGEMPLGRPWTTAWQLQPQQAGIFNVKVSYRGDSVHHAIQVKEAGTHGAHYNIAEITSFSRILSAHEIVKLTATTAPPRTSDDYEYPEYSDEDDDDQQPSNHRIAREAGTNINVHELLLTVQPKITLTKWNMSIELLTGFRLSDQDLHNAKAAHAYVESFKQTNGTLVLNMKRMERGSETEIKLIMLADTYIENRQQAAIRIHHEAAHGPLVVHHYNMGEPEPPQQLPICT